MRSPRAGHQSIGEGERKPVGREQVRRSWLSQRAGCVRLDETVNDDDADNYVLIGQIVSFHTNTWYVVRCRAGGGEL